MIKIKIAVLAVLLAMASNLPAPPPPGPGGRPPNAQTCEEIVNSWTATAAPNYPGSYLISLGGGMDYVKLSKDGAAPSIVYAKSFLVTSGHTWKVSAFINAGPCTKTWFFTL